MIGQRPSGEEVHLEASNEPFSIARQDPSCRWRIEPCDHAMQELDTPAVGNVLQPPAQAIVGRGPGKESPDERAIVQTGAADENRLPSTRVDLPHSGSRLARKPGGGVLLGWICDVDEV